MTLTETEAVAETVVSLASPGVPPPISDIQHRVVQSRGKRYSLKLERAFWEFLESLAEQRGTKLGELLGEMAARMPRGANFAATLRRICLEEALGEARDQRSFLKINLASIIEAISSPALMVAHDGRIVGANAAFGQWMHAKPDGFNGQPLERFFQVKAPLPVAAMLERVRAGRSEAFPAKIGFVVREKGVLEVPATICIATLLGKSEYIYLVAMKPSAAS